MGFTKTPDSLELNLEITLTLTSLAHMSQNQLDVRYVARLARLELSDEEIAEFQPQLNAIMEHVEALKELNIEVTPQHPETELRKAGALYESQTAFRDLFATHVVVDEEKRFVTGQNQNSACETAQRMLDQLV